MYLVALEKSKGLPSLEATAICNYATFLFRYRKKNDEAAHLFQRGLTQ